MLRTRPFAPALLIKHKTKPLLSRCLISALLAGIILLSASCRKTPHFHTELAQIIQQHYTELPTRRELKPLCLHSEWVKGKDSTFHQAGTNESFWLPPPPPDETVVVHPSWLSMLEDTTGQYGLDSAYVSKLVAAYYHSPGLSPTPELELLANSQLCRTYREFQDRTLACARTFYFFSEPICNEARNICWFEVDINKGPASSGWRMIYRKQGQQWKPIYSYLIWIS